MKPVRVLLADDHALLRAGVRVLLERSGDLEIVGEASDGHETLSAVASLQPDVLVLDLSLPGLHGLEVAERVAREHPNVRTLVLSVHTSEAHVARALRAGARGYLAKDAAPGELEQAIRAVARGERPLGHSVASLAPATDAEVEHPLQKLTPRQREVLQLVAEGLNTKEIAFRLSLSVKTVETHRSQIMQRLDIFDVPGLVRFAIRAGLITPES